MTLDDLGWAVHGDEFAIKAGDQVRDDRDARTSASRRWRRSVSTGQLGAAEEVPPVKGSPNHPALLWLIKQKSPA